MSRFSRKYIARDYLVDGQVVEVRKYLPPDQDQKAAAHVALRKMLRDKKLAAGKGAKSGR